MRKARVILTMWLLFAAGCGKETGQAITTAITGRSFEPPDREWIVVIPRSMPSVANNDVCEGLNQKILDLPAGTWITILLGDNLEVLASFRIPDGVPNQRLRTLRQELANVYERLDPENIGGSQDINLIGLPAKLRSERKTTLPMRLVICGSTMIKDPEGNLSIGDKEMPCDGVLLDPKTSWGKMERFPKDVVGTWFKPQASYGNGPNFMAAVEEFIALAFATKDAELLRVTSDAAVAFNATTSQWDERPKPRDTCNGLKRVPVDEKPEVYDDEGDRVVDLGKIEIIEKDPTPENLAGGSESFVFWIDMSQSVWQTLDGEDVGHRFLGIQNDVCQKLSTMPMDRFAIIVFGGDKHHRPRIGRYPTTMFGGLKWAEATPSNRKAATEYVKGISPGGGTPTLAALREAMKLGPDFVGLLYTDGVPTIGDGDQSAVLELTELMAASNIVVNTIGVGPLSTKNESLDYSGAEFLGMISYRTNGRYFPLETTPKTVATSTQP